MVFNGRPATRDEVNALLKAASAAGAPLAATDVHGDVLGFEERPLVSTDYVNDPRSSIVDAASTMVVGGSMVKIYAWYDNEVGTACAPPNSRDSSPKVARRLKFPPEVCDLSRS